MCLLNKIEIPADIIQLGAPSATKSHKSLPPYLIQSSKSIFHLYIEVIEVLISN